MRGSTYIAISLLLPAYALAGVLPAGAAQAVDDIFHHTASDPIEVAVALAGPVGLGGTTVLSATLTPTWAGITEATTRLELSDGIETSDPLTRHVTFVAGVPAVVHYTIRVTQPGTQLAAVTASGFIDALAVGGYGQGYLDVPESGLATYYPEQLPAPTVVGTVAPIEGPPVLPPLSVLGSGEMPGPGVGGVSLPVPERNGETGDSGDIGTESHATFVVTGCWNYQTEAGGAARQRFATVQVWDDDTLDDDLLWTGITDSTGCFTSAAITRAEECCFSGNQDVYVIFHAWSTWGRITNTGGTIYSWSTGVTTIGSQDVHNVGDLMPTSSQFANRVYQYIMNGQDFARNNMQIAGLGEVRVNIPDSCTFYTRSDDIIHLCANNVDDKSPDDVLHEFGHYVQDKAYGDTFWPSPGGAHSLCADNQNRGLSWTEGFANFFGPRANNEIVQNGANGDVLYSRPYNGATFALNMETNSCGVSGDDNEMNVAQALWDLRDNANDGLDVSTDTNVLIANVVEACDDSNYQDYFGGSCSWASNGGNNCNFLRTAFQNSIDFNSNPTASVTSQTSFQWIRGTYTLSGTITDAEGGCPTITATFRVSANNICSDIDTLAGTDTSSPYSVSFSSATFGDSTTAYTCLLANDGIENSLWAISAQYGIDNGLPSLSNSFSGTLGNAGWYRSSVTATVTCSDATSGVSSRQYRLNGGSWLTYSSPVTLSSQGSTTFQSQCTDVAGNVAQSSTSTISIDTSNPSTSATLSGTLGSGGWYTSAVTVSITCTDPSPGSGCSFNQYSVDGGGWVTGNSVTVSGQGAHTVQFRSQDVAGNLNTGGSSSFSIDTTLPSLSLSLSGTMGNLGWYRSAVTVTLTCTDATSGVSTREYSLNGGAYQAYSSPVTVSDQGENTFAARCRDVAGHQATASQGFSIDTVAPTSSVSRSGTLGQNGWYTTPVDLTVACNDPSPGSGCSPQYELNGGGFVNGGFVTVSGDGSHAFSHRAVDAAGNVGSATSDPFKIDKVAPALSIGTSGTLGSGGWYVSSVTVTLTCSDATSGVASRTYSLNGGASQAYTSPFTVSTQGANSVSATCTDNAGHPTPASASFNIDTASPTTNAALAGTPGDGGWFRSSVSATLACTDPAPGSGCAATESNLDGAGFVPGASVSITGDGTHTLAYRSTDVAGNLGSTGSSTVRIDTVAPSLSLSVAGTVGDGGWYRSAVTVTSSCSDATSGVGSQTYTVNGGSPQSYTGPISVNSEGTTTLVVTCRDAAGNSASDSRTLQIDTQGPTGSISVPPVSIGAITVAWSASDATSGLTGTLEIQEQNAALGTFATVCTFGVSGATASGSCVRNLPPGQYCWRMVVRDVAGNVLMSPVPSCSLVAGTGL